MSAGRTQGLPPIDPARTWREIGLIIWLLGTVYRLFALESEASGDNLDDVVTAVTIIAQTWCEHVIEYTDIKTLVWQSPIDQYTFAAYDAFALKQGPNWQIHQHSFWEQHAYMGMHEDKILNNRGQH